MELVIDASIVLKWFLDEDDSDEALTIRENAFAQKFSLHTTELLFFEITNILSIHPMPSTLRKDMFSDLYSVPFVIHSYDDQQAYAASDLAVSCAISAYDASYIVLAQHLRCPFLTADQKLITKTKSIEEVVLDWHRYTT